MYFCNNNLNNLAKQEESEVALELPGNDISRIKKSHICNCIMGCTSIEYEKSISQSYINVKETLKNFDLKKNYKE